MSTTNKPGSAALRMTGTRQAAFPAWGWLCLLAVMAAYLGLKARVIDRYDNVLRISSLHNGQVRGSQPLQVSFGGKLRLLGYNVQTREAPAGGEVSLYLYWQAEQRLDKDYSIGMRLVDEQGRVWGQHDNWQPSGMATSSWETDGYRSDGHHLTIPPGTPPGRYGLQVLVYERESLERLNAQAQDGAPLGPLLNLPEASIQVTRPQQPPDPASLGLEHTLNQQLNDDLELLGAIVAPGPRSPGARVHLDLFWRALRRPAADYSARAFLLGPSGKALERDLGPLAGEGYTTTQWQAGEVIHGQYELLVPAEAEAGVNALQIALSSSGRPVAVGEVPVEAIERRMDAPPLQQPVGAVFADRIALLGYDLDAQSVGPGDTVHLRLYWQARQSMEQEYTVFTHLLDAGNQIVAQQDSAPMQGARPTTGWLPGEVLADEYALTLPADAAPGDYPIEVGLYEPGSGRRLQVSDTGGAAAGDRLILGVVMVR